MKVGTVFFLNLVKMWEFHLSNNVIACDSAASNLTAQNLQPLTLNLRFFRRWLRNFLQWLQVLFMTMKRRLCLLAEETVAPAEETAEETVFCAEETLPPAEETESELPAEAAGSKSPAEVAKVPEVAETPEAEVAKVQEKPLEISGFFSAFDAVRHQQQQKELKEKIIADIEKRRAQIAAKVENERMAQQDAWHPAPPEEKEIPEEPEKTAQAPFNAFGAKDSAQLAVKEEVDSSEENDLCVQDLRHCQACKTKSYIRQGLCINIYCKLYFMGRADSGTCLCARGKLSEGRKWSPQEWVSSGSFAQVEESLLKENFEEALQEVAPYGPPPMKRAKLAIPAGETIVIEDLRSCSLKQLEVLHLVQLLMPQIQWLLMK